MLARISRMIRSWCGGASGFKEKSAFLRRRLMLPSDSPVMLGASAALAAVSGTPICHYRQ